MRGIISALVIPFTKDGKIDFEGLKSVVVGSAITRPQLITKKYVKAIKERLCEE